MHMIVTIIDKLHYPLFFFFSPNFEVDFSEKYTSKTFFYFWAF